MITTERTLEEGLAAPTPYPRAARDAALEPDSKVLWRRGPRPDPDSPSVTLIFSSGESARLGENALLVGRATYLARELLHRRGT